MDQISKLKAIIKHGKNRNYDKVIFGVETKALNSK